MEESTLIKQKKIKTRHALAKQFRIDIDLFPLVFQHLTGSDLLRLSEVSRMFYQLTSRKEELLKIQIIVKEGWDREFDAEVIRHTNRKYTSINVNQLLRRRDQVLKLFNNFAEHLMSIETCFDFEMGEILLPHLKFLRINMKLGIYLQKGLLSCVSNLERLQISGEVRFPENIVNCLKSNIGLKELALEDGTAEAVFRCMMKQPIEVQLNVLKIYKSDFKEPALTNFCDFLETQVDSLKELKLLRCDLRVMADIFNELPNLKRLTYSPSNYDFFPKPEFQEHMNIEEMNLILVNNDQFENLLSHVPNLKNLYIADPSVQMFKFLIYNAPGLREFRFAYFEEKEITAEILKDHIEDLKARNCSPRLNRNIEVISQI